ncbi:MAG: hypothetical protein Q4E22_03395, partial [Coriobacteriia bacterium]|nr:hypothetical protein [Coriobacteriia bacterium]
LDDEVLGDRNFIRAELNKVAQALLNVVIADDQGTQKTVGDLANTAYLTFLKGDEVQPQWVVDTLQTYREDKNNFLQAVLLGAQDTLGEIIKDVAVKIDYNPQDLVKLDKKETFLNRPVMKVIWGKLGTNLGESLDGLGLQPQDLVTKLLGVSMLNGLFEKYSTLALDVIDAMTKEQVEGFDYVYLEDNNTKLLDALMPAIQAKGSIVQEGEDLRFVNDLDAQNISEIQVLKNGSLVKTLSAEKIKEMTLNELKLELEDLKNDDQIQVVASYYNEFGNKISLASKPYKLVLKTDEQKPEPESHAKELSTSSESKQISTVSPELSNKNRRNFGREDFYQETMPAQIFTAKDVIRVANDVFKSGKYFNENEEIIALAQIKLDKQNKPLILELPIYSSISGSNVLAYAKPNQVLYVLEINQKGNWAKVIVNVGGTYVTGYVQLDLILVSNESPAKVDLA